ncbi:hypothetical protein BC832DRAFT_550293 [Gaertneriomyces semiglobifer]|nr:hypothetical protein BC832DRAFT_550293 [Gaertneriomyces semiglobifer]
MAGVKQVLPVSRLVFDKYDVDKSGEIRTAEFRNMCHQLGYHLSDEELNLAVKKLDVNGDGRISYDEFINWWRQSDRFKHLQLSEAQQARLQQAVAYFDYFDTNKNGTINKSEFTSMFEDLVKNGLVQANASHDQVWGELDTSSDGDVSFNEFTEWLVRKGRLEGSQ